MSPPDSTAERLGIPPRSAVHLVGIGGVGMAGLAGILQQQGFRVSGTDLQRNGLTRTLEQRGVKVFHEHGPERIPREAHLVIFSSAIASDHPERLEAARRGIKTLRRGEAFARLTRVPGSVAVSGTHGKTTTTALLVHFLQSVNAKPDWFVGSEGVDGRFVADWEGREHFVFEADESDGTLIHYHPDSLVITNIDYDHMEHHTDEAAFLRMFEIAASQAVGHVVLPLGDSHAAALSLGGGAERLGFGLGEGPGVRASAWQLFPDRSVFTLRVDGTTVGEAVLGVPGLYNIQNALAACAVLHGRGIDLAQILPSMSRFQNRSRRLELLHEGEHGWVVTDYAHHPTEIEAVCAVLRRRTQRRLRVVFQPHRYTRTRALRRAFSETLLVADELFLLPVYPASEIPLEGGMIEDLLDEIHALGYGPVSLFRNGPDLLQALQDSARSGDGVAFLGAGDVDAWAREYARNLNKGGEK